MSLLISMNPKNTVCLFNSVQKLSQAMIESHLFTLRQMNTSVNWSIQCFSAQHVTSRHVGLFHERACKRGAGGQWNAPSGVRLNIQALRLQVRTRDREQNSGNCIWAR